MNVGSVLEIYTTMYGFALFNTLYDLLNVTGLLYYPFLMILYRSWSEPYLSQGNKPASLTSERRMRYSMVSAIMVFGIAAVPYADVNVEELRYRIACTDGGAEVVQQDVQGGDTDTTYDTKFNDENAVRIPIIWWLALATSSGINYVATSSFKCFEDIKGLDQQLRNLTIKDPVLRAEYMRFANECFLPAKSKYLAAMRGGVYHDYVEDSLNDFVSNTVFDQTDPFFIGSHYYLTTFGFYRAFDLTTCSSSVSGCGFRAAKPVVGWAYEAARDNYSQPDIDAGTPGRPYCDEWWTDATLGLRPRMLAEIEASEQNVDVPDSFATLWDWIRDSVINIYNDITLTDAQIEDLVISNYVARNPPDFTGSIGSAEYTSLNTAPDDGGSFVGSIGKKAAMWGGRAAVTNPISLSVLGIGASKVALDVAETFGGFYLTMFLLKSVAPMVQAILLMMIYGLLIIYLVIGEYEVDKVISALLIIFTLRFFTPLWAIADYLDAQLFLAMYPDATLLGSVFTHGINRLLLDMVLTVLFIAVPAVLLFMVTAAGMKMGGGGAGGLAESISGPVGSVGKGVSRGARNAVRR